MDNSATFRNVVDTQFLVVIQDIVHSSINEHPSAPLFEYRLLMSGNAGYSNIYLGET